uniref:Uncharacterized protein n=1 Tax=Anguilla anguilla TaxID=7936 RepID=A0A0E9V3E5_ANGAN
MHPCCAHFPKQNFLRWSVGKVPVPVHLCTGNAQLALAMLR